MKTRTKTLIILTTAAALTLGIRAQEETAPTQAPEKQTAEIKCQQTCAEPSLTQEELVQIRRIIAHSKQIQQQFRSNQRKQMAAGTSGPEALPQRFSAEQRRNFQNIRQRRINMNQQHPARVGQIAVNARPKNAQQRIPAEQRQNLRKQRAMRFDIDGDGELSPAERAALKAYRTALRQEHEANRPTPETPVADAPVEEVPAAE